MPYRLPVPLPVHFRLFHRHSRLFSQRLCELSRPFASGSAIICSPVLAAPEPVPLPVTFSPAPPSFPAVQPRPCQLFTPFCFQKCHNLIALLSVPATGAAASNVFACSTDFPADLPASAPVFRVLSPPDNQDPHHALIFLGHRFSNGEIFVVIVFSCVTESFRAETITSRHLQH